MRWTKHHTIGCAAAVAIGGLAIWGLSAMAPGETARAFGPGLSIDVVAPIEPEPEPGEIMQVGGLTDGYEHREIEPEPMEPLPAAWVEDEPWSEPPAPARVWSSEPPAPVAASAPGQPTQFGFDEPQPDYAGQRQARRERMERMEAERTAAPGVRLTGDSVFY